jgi:nitrite reductase (NADH) small subunit
MLARFFSGEALRSPFRMPCFSVGPLAALPLGGSLGVTSGSRGVAIFHTDDGIFALEDHCPHRGASLGRGRVEEGCVICPLHLWKFRLADGQCPDIPTARAACYPVEVREGIIWVTLPAEEASDLR